MKIIIIRLIYVELARKTEKTSYYYMKTSNSNIGYSMSYAV